MIAGFGYGYGRALGAQGYGFAYQVANHDGRRKISDDIPEEEEFIYLVATILPLIIGGTKWRK